MTFFQASVLMADADAAMTAALSEELGRAGVQVERVADDQAVLLRMHKQAYNAIVVDVNLPAMGGLKMLERLARRWPDIPVILTAEQASVSLAVEAVKSGASDFLAKPLDPDEFVFTLNKAVTGAANEEDEPPKSTYDTGPNLVGSCCDA